MSDSELQTKRSPLGTCHGICMHDIQCDVEQESMENLGMNASMEKSLMFQTLGPLVVRFMPMSLSLPEQNLTQSIKLGSSWDQKCMAHAIQF
jgi:hypothetical protein